MAFIGMRHVVVAKLTEAATEGAMPTYEAGKVVGAAIQADLNITRNSNPLRGDDVIIDDDNGITAMALTIGVDDVEEDVQAYMGLLQEVAGTGTEKEYYETAGSAKHVGVGYLRVRRRRGKTTYQGIWVLDVLFGIESEAAATKGETIEWQTPTLNGTAMAHLVTEVNASDPIFRRKKNFATAEAAIAWLDGLAGI